MVDCKRFIKHALLFGVLLFSSAVHAQPSLPHALGCYRSFTREPETAKIFAQELGVKTRCFFAANTINSRSEYYCQYPPIWVGEGKYEFEHFDEQMDEMVTANPDGNFICMIDLNTPYWLTRRIQPDSYTDPASAAANPNWIKITLRWMKDFITYAEAHYGDRIIGYVLSGGGTSEWYDGVRGHPTRAKSAAWKKWCEEQGIDDGPDPPAISKLNHASFEGHLYDPEADRAQVNYWRFHNGLIADAILTYAREARAMLPKEKQIGVFFGYYFIGPTRPVSWGHLEYERVYASPDISFFIAPGSYSNRGIGGGSGSQAMFMTAMLNGKRFMHEIDFTPHDYWTRQVGWKTVEDDIAGNTRESCFALINHLDYWWFDMWGGFYANPKLRERIGEMEKIQERFREDLSPSVAEVLYVADPKSLYYVREGDPFARAGAEAFRNQLSLIGAPYDCCSFSDLEKMDLSQYKVVLMPQLFLIDEARAAFLREKVCTDGRTVLFAYAPGIIDGKTLDPSRVKAWAGVPFGKKGDPVSETPMGEWNAVYAYEAEAFTTDVIRNLCGKAGVHFYVDPGIPVFANSRLVSIHCKEGGPRTVSLPAKAARVVDLLSGEVVAKRAKTFKIECASPDTQLFEIIWK